MSSTTPPGLVRRRPGRTPLVGRVRVGGARAGPVRDSRASSPTRRRTGLAPSRRTASSPTASSRRQEATGLVIGIVAALVVVGGGIVAAVLLLGGGDGPSSDDPAATVEAFVDAARDGDCDAVDDLLTDDGKALFGGDACAEGVDASATGVDTDDVDVEVGDATEDGDTATVPVTYTAPGTEEIGIDYSLVRQDGDWLIDGVDLPGLDDIEIPELPSTSDLPEMPEMPEMPSFDPDDLPTDPEDLQSFLEELGSQLTDGPTR